MTIAERKIGAATVLDLSGKFTSDDSGMLKTKVASLLGDGCKQIVLNLGGVNFIDSSGLGEMVGCHTSASRSQAKISLVNLGKRSQELLVITKLNMVFDVYATEKEALAGA